VAEPFTPSSSARETLSVLLTEGNDSDPALYFPDGGRRLSYGALANLVDEHAGILASVGVVRGDRVAIVLPDGPPFLLALFAVTALGAAAAPLNPAYTRDEYTFYLHDLRPRILLLPAGEIPAARSAAVASGIPVADLVEDGEPTLSVRVGGKTFDRPSTFEPAGPDDIALLLHTSGTTSRPKQVPLLHRNLLASARTIVSHYALGPEDVSYCAMPLFHVHGLVASVLAPFGAGGTCVVPRRFSPRRLLEELAPNRVTWYSAGPTLHQMIVERMEPGKGSSPSTLRFLRSCSSALTPALMERIETAFGVPVLEAYGMTEASHQIASNPLPPKRRVPGSVGLPTGAEIVIIDERGIEVSDGDPGEVAIRGPAVTPGYLNNPEANAEAFVHDWFRTGDLGSMSDRGYLRLEGRLKEMIIRGGENVSPYEVEDALRSHAAVADVVCFGISDEKYGEEVAAAVTLRCGATADELISHCRERLAAFKVPKSVHIVEAIPRTVTGKLQRQRMPTLLGLDVR
jgi:acyl-CoA synthetase (AMP-forming)/AMP-acid ligase II